MKDDDDDSLEKAIQEAVRQSTQRLARTTIGFLVVIVTSGTVYVGSGNLESYVRPDPFTNSDWIKGSKELKKEIQSECQKQWATADAHITADDLAMEKRIMKEVAHIMELHQLQIPPVATRARIYSLEQWALRSDPAFKPPTQDW